MLRHIIPSIIASITRRPRYIVNPEWVSGCWTHNVFRAFEWLFGRAYGPGGIGDTIKKESSVRADLVDGVIHVERSFYTVEALTAHIESVVRAYLKKAFEPKPQYGFVPQPVFMTMMLLGLKLSFHADLNGMLAPMIGLAIGYDNSNKGIANPGSSLTFSLTTSGSNRLLIIGGQLQDSSRSWSDITYAGVSATQIGSNIIYSANSAPGQMRRLIAPATGANNAVFTPSGSITIRGIAVNYTGVHQTSPVDATAQTSGGSSFNVNVVSTNCWMVCQCVGFNNDFDTPGPGYVTPAGVLTTIRQFYDDGMAITDSNGTVGTGNQAVQMSGLNSNNGIIGASIAPAANVVTSRGMFALLFEA